MFSLRSNSTLIHLTTDESTWFAGVTALAIIVGVLTSIPLSKNIGRKKLFMVSNCFSFVGYLGMYFAPTFLVLMISRITQCIGMGMVAMTLGVYLSEIATVKMRGPLIGISQTSICFGLLIATALCIVLPIELLSVVLATHSFIVTMVLIFIPASPHWLLINNKEKLANTSLRFLRGTSYPGIELEVEEIRNCIMEKDSVHKSSIFESFQARTFTKPLSVFSLIFVLLGSSGNDTIVFYGPTIFSTLNIGIPPTVLATMPWIGFSIGYASKYKDNDE